MEGKHTIISRKTLQRQLTKVFGGDSNNSSAEAFTQETATVTDTPPVTSKDQERAEHLERPHASSGQWKHLDVDEEENIADKEQENELQETIYMEQTNAPFKKNPIRLFDVGHGSIEGSLGHTNEDRYVVKSNANFHLFAVLDGHGGALAASYVVERLFHVLENVYDGGFEENHLVEAIDGLEKAFCRQAKRLVDYSGTCLLAVILYRNAATDTPQRITLNIGDCRAIIREDPEQVNSNKSTKSKSPSSSYGKIFALSDDHSASNRSEKLRVLEAGAYIQQRRIAGVLEPFRSIGDIDMKTRDMKDWVIATPEIRQSELVIGGSTIVLATDGVWSVLKNQRVMAIAYEQLQNRKSGAAQRAADAIIAEARKCGSQDDITCIVISV